MRGSDAGTGLFASRKRPRSPLKWILLTALIVIAGTVLIACGGGDDDDGAATAPEEATPADGNGEATPTPTEEAAPADGNGDDGPAGAAGGKLLYVDSNSRQIFRMSADGGMPTQITEGGSDPAWSLDGTQIAYVDTQGVIFVMNAADGVQRPVTAIDVSASEPTWSPDGKQIAYTEGQKIYRTEIDVAVPDPVLLTTGGTHPTWSPDGTQIAYIDSSSQLIFVMNAADGGQPTQLTATRGSHPTWSPDGTQIAYVDTSQRSIFVTDIEGGVPMPVTSIDLRATEPTWSPDGKQIAFTQDGNIYKVEIGFAVPERTLLTTGGSAPAWSVP